MTTLKSAQTKMQSIKDAAVDRIDHITTNEKIAGAAVMGVVAGVAATAIGTALYHGSEKATKTAKPVGKPAATKD